jgi:hypothetical protein
MTYTLHLGDCLDVMASLPDNSVDSIITDPPYGLEFMGKEWDHGIPGVAFWAAAPNQEKGLYGDCSVPLPISLSVYRYAMTAEEPIQGDTNAEKCPCFEVRWVDMIKLKISRQLESGEL